MKTPTYISTLLLFFAPIVARAQEGIVYKPLVTIPGFVENTGAGFNLGDYFLGVFKLGINISIVLAVVMIIYGGIQYMVSEVANTKSRAKERILGALGGLVLALSAFLILNTINPQLTRLDFEITSAKFSNTFNVWVYMTEGADGSAVPSTAFTRAQCEQERAENESLLHPDYAQSCIQRPPLNISTTGLWWYHDSILSHYFLSEEECEVERKDRLSDGAQTESCNNISCKNCGKLPSSLNTSPNPCAYITCSLNQNLSNQLAKMIDHLESQSLIFTSQWQIESAWPPKWPLSGLNNCLLNGTCVRIRLNLEDSDLETASEYFFSVPGIEAIKVGSSNRILELRLVRALVVQNTLNQEKFDNFIAPTEEGRRRQILGSAYDTYTYRNNEFGEFLIGINKEACRDLNDRDCTSLGGLSDTTVSKIKKLQTKCACEITITGGTEWWLHSSGTTHVPLPEGGKTVDLSMNNSELNTYLKNNAEGAGPLQNSNGEIYAIKYFLNDPDLGGRIKVVAEYDPSNSLITASGIPHWHVEF